MSDDERISRQVRIVSDGLYQGTRVEVDGVPLPKVRAVQVTIGMVTVASYGGDVETVPGEPAIAHIETIAPALDIVADATNAAVCPYCGHETEGWQAEEVEPEPT